MKPVRFILFCGLYLGACLLSPLTYSQENVFPTTRHISAEQIEILKRTSSGMIRGKIIIFWTPTPPTTALPLSAPQSRSIPGTSISIVTSNNSPEIAGPHLPETDIFCLQLKEVLKECGYDVMIDHNFNGGSFFTGVYITAKDTSEIPEAKLIQNALIHSKIKDVELGKGEKPSQALITIRVGPQ